MLRITRPMAIVLCLSAGGSSVAGAAKAAELAPHRALYTLSLERGDSDSA